MPCHLAGVQGRKWRWRVRDDAQAVERAMADDVRLIITLANGESRPPKSGQQYLP